MKEALDPKFLFFMLCMDEENYEPWQLLFRLAGLPGIT